MNISLIEQFYESVVLPQFSEQVTFKKVVWKDHGKVDLDAWAHYFDDEDGREYVLIYEDFPGDTFLNDGLTHEVVKLGNEKSLHVSVEPGKQVENLIGYFTLYREKLLRN